MSLESGKTGSKEEIKFVVEERVSDLSDADSRKVRCEKEEKTERKEKKK